MRRRSLSVLVLLACTETPAGFAARDSACAPGTCCVPCAADEVCTLGRCVPATEGTCDNRVCTPGLTCDPRTGECLCGGDRCADNEQCLDGRCADPCAAVRCAPDEVCNPEDRACHCGDPDGPLCGPAPTCVLNQSGPSCQGDDLCADVSCGNGFTCDPRDGQCVCSLTDRPVFPCSEPGAICDPETGTCSLPGRCFCDELPGTTCDPATGFCVCGGEACADGEACVDAACTSTCDFFGPAPCAHGLTCRPSLAGDTPVAVCTPDGELPEEAPCDPDASCEAGASCVDGRCRRLCDARPGRFTVCDADRVCVAFAGLPANIGVCLPP